MIELSTRRNAAALLLVLLAACSGGDARAGKSGGDETPSASHFTEDPSVSAVKIASAAYKPAASLGAVGSLSGTITLNGAPPPDTVKVTKDSAVCGATAAPRVTVDAKGDLSNAVVWIDDATTGKPLPIEKRAELSSSDCTLDPRVQAVVVGTTVNVFNDDNLVHKFVFHRVGESDTLTKMPFFTTGQVVASERLATKPGVVEVRCSEHPWTRGYILAFNHPYFAVTDTDGGFSIDSLPPGSYHVKVWHEGLAQPIDKTVQIAANGSAKLDLALTLTAAR
ncbi:MAG TPA: carboxypeptidase regulatory-like domain-containing protein [Gemmatimonadaceae bacterium]|nr:carboxypeptidase regulatory-like domain-containing protein [Gemmatimonadaceae bacterium]